MGGFTPATAALTLLQVGQTVAERKDAGKAAARAQEAESEMRAREIGAQQGAEMRDRQDRLRRTLARQRAAFGATGIASNSGSARALLGGLEAEAMAADAESRRLADLRLDRLAHSTPAARSGYADLGLFTQRILSPAINRRTFGSLLEP